MDATGAYTAERASALSGVPRSTIHWWARHEILVPSVSAERVKLWSYADLMALRVVYWLRRNKTTTTGAEIPATSMKAVRRALKRLREHEVPLWGSEHPSIWVDTGGEIYFPGDGGPETMKGQLGHDKILDLVAPFDTLEGLHGPHLVQPRPELRIVPGKLGGSPHVVHTRVETRALSALEDAGLATEAICKLYPYLTQPQIRDALDLEKQLRTNLAIPVAA